MSSSQRKPSAPKTKKNPSQSKAGGGVPKKPPAGSGASGSAPKKPSSATTGSGKPKADASSSTGKGSSGAKTNIPESKQPTGQQAGKSPRKLKASPKGPGVNSSKPNQPGTKQRMRPQNSLKPVVFDFLGQLFGAVLDTVRIANDRPSATVPVPTSIQPPPNAIESAEIRVPKRAVRYIIGSKAVTIKAIADKTGCNIKTPQRDGPPVFYVTGSKLQIEQARKEIDSVVVRIANKPSNSSNKPIEAEGSVTVPDKLVGLVIGAKGATLIAMEQALNVKISAPKKGEAPIFTISGTRKNIAEAGRRIEQIVAAASAPKQSQDVSSDSDDDSLSVASDVSATQSKTNGQQPKQPKQAVKAKKSITGTVEVSAQVIDKIDTALLAEIEKTTQTKVEASKDVSGFSISGSKNGIKRARLMIEGLALALALPQTASVEDSTSDSSGEEEADAEENGEEESDEFVEDDVDTDEDEAVEEEEDDGDDSSLEESDSSEPSGNNLIGLPATTKESSSDFSNEKTLTVFVSNVNYAATEAQLKELFSSCGKIKWAMLLKNKKSAPTGNALIEYFDEKAFQSALKFDGKEFLGRPIKVNPKKAKPPNGGKEEILAKTGLPQEIAMETIRRHVVIDADNVCMAHGRGQFYSGRGLELAVQYFETMGHKVLAVVPEEKVRRPPQAQMHRVEGQDILQRLENAGNIVLVPSKKLSDGSSVKPYADLLTVKYAYEEDGVIISNDNMIDVIAQHPEYKDVIEKRRIMFTFGLDKFMLVDDPNGRNGVKTTELLSYQKPRSHHCDLISFE